MSNGDNKMKTYNEVNGRMIKKIIKSLNISEITKVTARKYARTYIETLTVEIQTSVNVASSSENNEELNRIETEVFKALISEGINLDDFSCESGIFAYGVKA